MLMVPDWLGRDKWNVAEFPDQNPPGGQGHLFAQNPPGGKGHLFASAVWKGARTHLLEFACSQMWKRG